MKYMVLLCDGMADRPISELGGLTPMQKAYKPNMDNLAKISEVGMVKTVADSMKPGSDVANLSVMGYNPEECYT
ncbi:MAG: phosphoglycerate mutase, partial [Oscillospiraceae bacterium]